MYRPTVFAKLKYIFIIFLIIIRYYFINNNFIKNIISVLTTYPVIKFLRFYTFSINKYKELNYYEFFFYINNNFYLIYIRLIIIRTPAR